MPTRRDFIRGSIISAAPLPLVAGCAASRPLRAGPAGEASIATSAVSPDPGEAAPNRPQPAPAEDGNPAAEPAAAARLLPAPVFSRDAIERFVAGIRPYRSGRIRLEAEALGEKLIIHNYGHGGAGVTLSWGCAEECVRILHAAGRGGRGGRSGEAIAVLGAGVIGMSVAHELLRDGHDVTIYARDFTPATTSDIAGAQWAPSLVARGSAPDAPGQFQRILRTSHARFRAMVGSVEWGVFERINFDAGAGSGGGGLEDIPRDLIPPVEHVDPIPIQGVRHAGRAYQTMIIEPPIYLPRLLAEIESLGAGVVQREFSSMDDVLALQESVIINCLGLGAKPITGDTALTPMRGQLVHLQAQELPWLLSHDDGYIFPRKDAVLLGGTFERGVDDPTPRDATCRRIYERNRQFFA